MAEPAQLVGRCDKPHSTKRLDILLIIGISIADVHACRAYGLELVVTLQEKVRITRSRNIIK